MRVRLIVHDPLPGPLNMAVDEALLLCHEAGLSPPTLRIYRWNPPCLSLGVLQSLDSVDWLAFLSAGCDCVRRPSGGSAVLHQDEVTYAVVINPTLCPSGSSIRATFRWICDGLISGLKMLGIEAAFASAATGADPSRLSSCYHRIAPSDLTVSGRKLCGSAQARRRSALLQHGSLPLRWDMRLLSHFRSLDRTDSVTCLEWILCRPVAHEEIVRALIQGFSQALRWELRERSLTPLEWSVAQLLLQQKYGSWHWTARRGQPKDLRRISDALASLRLKAGSQQ